MGASLVPLARIFPPRATIKALAVAPWPLLKRTTVPGSILSVCPSFTNTKPSKSKFRSLVQVVVPVPLPLSLITLVFSGKI